MIPEFNKDGNLPVGIHWAGWQEFAERYGTSHRRRDLLSGLRSALEALREAGCQTAYIDGSFVTAKEDPNDWDGCWEHSTVDWARLDPVLLDDRNFRAAQKAKYGGELFPVSIRFNDTRTLNFFQSDRLGRPKGIVALDLTNLPHLRRQNA